MITNEAVAANDDLVIKLEEEVEVLRKCLKKLNYRVGDEIVNSSSDDSLDDDIEFETKVNTKYMQLDLRFASKYFYITNVSQIKCND